MRDIRRGGVEMPRIIACLVLIGFLVGASVVTARAADGGTTTNKTDNEPVVKSDDSTKSEAREDERPAIESEMQELRDLVQSQTEELNDLRKRLAAVEAGGAAS